MTRPQRRLARMWERKAVTLRFRDDLDDLDDPPHGRKPHQYFW